MTDPSSAFGLPDVIIFNASGFISPKAFSTLPDKVRGKRYAACIAKLAALS